MNHIYIHIPFCLQKCSYCDFYSVNTLNLLDQYVEVLISEIESYRNEYAKQSIKTIFFGGGTPSVLSASQLAKIIDKLRAVFKFEADIEFTLEINPETYEKQKFLDYKALGVTRISVGVQSFDDHYLKRLERIHDSTTAKNALIGITSIFDNVNIDLMYGLPEENIEHTKKNILEAVKFKPKHISFYELTPVLSNDPEMYIFGKKILETSGYFQYEISNYSLKGYECRHNLAYWSDKSYLGLGAGAHSYSKEKQLRWFNNTLEEYLQAKYKKGEEPAQNSERIIMGLRKITGIPKQLIPKDKVGIINGFIAKKYMEQDQQNYFFTEQGRLISNSLLVDLI